MITSMVAFSIVQLVQRLWQPLQTFIKYIYELVVCRLPSNQNRNAAREGGITIERWNHNLTCVPRKRRNVSFSTMEIRTYESILGEFAPSMLLASASVTYRPNGRIRTHP